MTTPDTDPLLAALRQLPPRPMDEPAGSRLERQARAAYVRGFDGSATGGGGVGGGAAAIVTRFAVPVFLAGIVGLYMTWALGAATALLQ
jgi:hypothetical protein